MKATDILMQEHRVIERLLTVLDGAAGRLAAGAAVPARTFLDLAAMAAGFADEFHHRKEEGVLFPALVGAGLPGESGPVGMMLAEHAEGRRLTRELRAAAQRMADGEAAAGPDVVRHAAAYVELLRLHIQKEDQVLFPMADEVLPHDVQAQVDRDFAALLEADAARGVPARYLTLLESFEEAAAAGA